MKLNKIATLIAVCTVIASTGSIFAGKANASGVGGTAYFSGDIAASCGVTVDFTSTSGTPNTYDKTSYASSGGTSKLDKSENTTINCNSDTVDVTATVIATPPTAPANATLLEGVHTATITGGNDATNDTMNGDGSTTLNSASPWKTDNQGNIVISVKSTWNPSSGGQELFEGNYLANVALSVTPN